MVEREKDLKRVREADNTVTENRRDRHKYTPQRQESRNEWSGLLGYISGQIHSVWPLMTSGNGGPHKQRDETREGAISDTVEVMLIQGP